MSVAGFELGHFVAEDDIELIQTLVHIFVNVEDFEVSATRNEILVALEHLVNYDN